MDENGYFLWEDQEWTFFNLNDLGDGSDENSHRKVLNFNVSNSQSLPLPKMDAVHLACGKMVAPLGGNSGGNVQGNEYKGNGNGRELLGHERYLWTERDRRKKIKNMFTILQDLLQLPPKVDRSTILDEAVKHIETLQNTLNHLTEQKLGITKMAKGEAFPIVFKNWTSPNVALNVCGNDAHINICCSIKLGFLSSICSVLEKYKIEVLSALVSSEDNRIMCMIHARVVGEYACQLPAEEIYKQAIEEIITICG